MMKENLNIFHFDLFEKTAIQNYSFEFHTCSSQKKFIEMKISIAIYLNILLPHCLQGVQVENCLTFVVKLTLRKLRKVRD